VAVIQLDHLNKTYPDGTAAVADADFTIEDGEFFILVGPSGCGKSTLLNMIVGLEDITDGKLLVDGQVMNGVDPKDRNMAMVFQSYAIYPHLTVRDNIAFPLKIRKMEKAEIDRRVAEASTTLELDEILDKKPANLSGGQRQRVAMGRAIVRDPTVWLMDEPLSNLDAKLRVQTRGQIASLQDRTGVTTVYVTHDQTEALTLGDRVAVMRKGEVQQVGTPRELYNTPANLFVAGFIGSPAMNMLPAEVKDGRIVLPVGEVAMPAELKRRYRGGDGRVLAGIRPEQYEDLAYVSDDIVDEGLTFTTKVETLEWLGSEVYAYFKIDASSVTELEHLAEDLSDVFSDAHQETRTSTARLDISTTAKPGEPLEMWLDARKMQLFDPETGDNLSLPEGS
jgi:multiple sugar transport system ATP-binding protein